MALFTVIGNGLNQGPLSWKLSKVNKFKSYINNFLFYVGNISVTESNNFETADVLFFFLCLFLFLAMSSISGPCISFCKCPEFHMLLLMPVALSF